MMCFRNSSRAVTPSSWAREWGLKMISARRSSSSERSPLAISRCFLNVVPGTVALSMQAAKTMVEAKGRVRE